jgi:hypothetical protein
MSPAAGYQPTEVFSMRKRRTSSLSLQGFGTAAKVALLGASAEGRKDWTFAGWPTKTVFTLSQFRRG